MLDVSTTQALNEDQSVTQTYTARVTDDKGAYVDQTVTVTINGTNDVPVITSESTAHAASLTEAGHLDNGQAVLNGMGFDGLVHATGTLSAIDVDNGDHQQWSIPAGQSTLYGTMSIDAASGVWSYALNNYLPATQALKEGEVVTQTYTARATDDFGGFVDQTITITITGTNDVPVINNDATALLGSVTEAGNLVVGTDTATGTLNAGDVDASATQTWSLEGSSSTTYGVMTIDSQTGVWLYTLDNTKSATQALFAGQVETQAYTARVTDDKGAYVNQLITVTITGTNDAAILSAATVNLSETNAALSTSGTLSISDVDSAQTFVAQTNVAGSYGTFNIDSTGAWTYLANSAYDALSVGANHVDTFTVASADGTLTSVTVTIAGTNDAAVITGASTASLTETNLVLSTSGTLSATDIDSPALFVAQTDASGSHGYGKFSIGTDGVWTYTTDTAHDEFGGGTTYTDSVTVATADGTTQIITVSMLGTNDSPTGSVTISGTPTQGQTLTATNTLADAEGLGAVVYQWFADGSAIRGATSATLVLGQTEVGKSITVRASYTDGFGHAESMTSSATSAVANVDEAASGTLAVTGTASEGGRLVAALTAVSDPDGSITNIAYQWREDRSGTWAVIAGAINATLTIPGDQSYVGKSLDVVVTTTDALGGKTAFTSAAQSIANVNDAPIGSVTIRGTATQGQTLTAVHNLADADGLGAISYQWSADGTAIGGATSDTLLVNQDQVGKAITVAASYIDGYGAAESVTSSAMIAHAAGVQPVDTPVVDTLLVTPSGASTPTPVSLELNTGNAGSDVISLAQALDAPDLPDSLTAPLGVFDLVISGNTTGGESFSLYVDSSLGVNGYWVENADGVWVNLASPAYGGSTVIEGDKIRLDFTIQDGGSFDTAGAANVADGTVAVAGAAAHMELSLIGHIADAPVGGFFF